MSEIKNKNLAIVLLLCLSGLLNVIAFELFGIIKEHSLALVVLVLILTNVIFYYREKHSRRIIVDLASISVIYRNILQAILFVCRWFYPYGDEPDNDQAVVMPLYKWIFRPFKEKPGIWRLGKNNLDNLRLCFIPGFTACNHPIFCSSERTYHPLCQVCF